ncbi:MAG: IS4 family transposase [Thermonemataceae bacterium]|nr:IS4 family transposase [Thermonemataceae bacterium]
MNMAEFDVKTSCEHSELYKVLQTKLEGFHQSRLKFLVLFLIALLKVQTVCLTKLANGFSGKAIKKSKVRRIQRFLADFDLDFNVLARLLWSFLGFDRQKVVLLMDRTNWQFGVKEVNILMLSVAYQGVAVPLFWVLLDKKGNSDQAERIALMERFVAVFGVECIDYLSADREFIGQKWLSYLQEKQIDFVIRIRENALVNAQKGFQVKQLFRHLRVNEGYFYTKERQIYGVKVFISARRGVKDKLILISSRFTLLSIEKYALRWEIETMFKAFKTQGFQLEDSHITDLQRFEKLLALLSIAFYWAYQTGIVKDKEVLPIQIIKSTGKQEYSFFVYGLDTLTEVLLQLNYQLLNRYVKLLS